ncbi:porin [Yoonia sp.]|jgi:hypothetical protein|uniref:porin n=1 Tax=Yoonia sp. TaxID=2212373 RepID=UPI0025F84BA4|nr:porin [Yoonia sp.]
MLRTLTTTAIIALIAGSATADGVNYGRFSYDFTNFDDGFNEADISIVQGAIEYGFGQVLITADIVSTTVEDGGSFDFQQYSLGGGYLITPEILVGAGVIGIKSELSDQNGYEIFGQYQTDQFGVALNVAKPDSDADYTYSTLYGEVAVTPAVNLGLALSQYSDESWTYYVASAEYNEGPIAARAYYQGYSDEDTAILGLRGSYELNAPFRILASYETIVGDDLVDISVYTVGGGYRITDGVWFDANIGQITGDSVMTDIDRVQATITFETGKRTRIDNSFNQDALDDRLAGLGSFIF